MKSLTYDALLGFVHSAAAVRCRRTLQPAGGPGTKVFPPTYSGAVYATEQRRLPGREHPVACVLLDSVQSQANRMEEALQQAIDNKMMRLPLIQVDFTKVDLPEPVGVISSLQVPHRIADAILRDSVDSNGVPFRSAKGSQQSEVGTQLDNASATNATPLYQYCPAALLFGLWDSSGFRKRDRGVKIERAIVSEIVAVNVAYGVKTGSRIDPLEIRRNAAVVYRTPNGGWTLSPEEAMKGKNEKPVLFAKNTKGQDVEHDPESLKLPDQGRPSVINHGNVTPSFSKYARGAEGPDIMQQSEITFDYAMRTNNGAADGQSTFKSFAPSAKEGAIAPGGVTFEYAEQTITLSLIQLRRLRFPLPQSKGSAEVDQAAQAVLAALGLCAATLAAEKGMDLRSRCLLWPEKAMVWELLGKPGEITEFALDSESAIKLLNDAVAHAEKLGLKWIDKPLVLKPSKQLVELVRKSQESAAKGDVAEGD